MNPYSIFAGVVLSLLASCHSVHAEDVYITFPTCADNLSLCKSEKERQQSIENSKKRDAAASAEREQAEAAKVRREAEIQSLKLGQARRKEAERFIALKDAAEKARSQSEATQKSREAELIRCHGSLENAKKAKVSCQ